MCVVRHGVEGGSEHTARLTWVPLQLCMDPALHLQGKILKLRVSATWRRAHFTDPQPEVSSREGWLQSLCFLETRVTGPGSGWFRNGAPGTPQRQSAQTSVWARFLFTLHFTWESRAFLWLQMPSGCQRPIGLFLHPTCPPGSRPRHGPAWGHSPAGLKQTPSRQPTSFFSPLRDRHQHPLGV